MRHLSRWLPTSTLRLLLLACLVACGTPQPADEGAAPSPAAETAEPASGGESAPIAPLRSSGRIAAEPATGARIQGNGILFHLPEGWRQEAPASAMRMTQAAIPGEAGDGELTVFYFGPGGGGGVEANLQRWIGQVEQEPGSAPRRDNFEVGPLRVTWVEVEGTLKASTMGTGPTTDQPGSRLLAAVVEGPGGPWFFKATGPGETLAAQRDAFMSLLASLEPMG